LPHFVRPAGSLPQAISAALRFARLFVRPGRTVKDAVKRVGIRLLDATQSGLERLTDLHRHLPHVLPVAALRHLKAEVFLEPSGFFIALELRRSPRLPFPPAPPAARVCHLVLGARGNLPYTGSSIHLTNMRGFFHQWRNSSLFALRPSRSAIHQTCHDEAKSTRYIRKTRAHRRPGPAAAGWRPGPHISSADGTKTFDGRLHPYDPATARLP
jgi:hypothetical protein